MFQMKDSAARRHPPWCQPHILVRAANGLSESWKVRCISPSWVGWAHSWVSGCSRSQLPLFAENPGQSARRACAQPPLALGCPELMTPCPLPREGMAAFCLLRYLSVHKEVQGTGRLLPFISFVAANTGFGVVGNQGHICVSLIFAYLRQAARPLCLGMASIRNRPQDKDLKASNFSVR